MTATPSQFFVTNDLATGKQSALQGTIANQTKLLVNMISKELKAPESLVRKQNTTYTINIAIYFYFHATVHSRKLFHTVLQEAKNSVNTIYKSIKHVVLSAGGATNTLRISHITLCCARVLC